MHLPSVIRMQSGNRVRLPECYNNDDVRSADALVAYFVELFTHTGEVVFDPFAGFGTTLFIAEQLDRVGCGVEFLQDRVVYIQSILLHPENILNGSALKLSELTLPQIDFSFSSPPYMRKNEHEQYPFAAYAVTGDGYAQYLRDIKSVYAQLKHKMKPGAYAVIEVSNIIHNEVTTPLAFDVAHSVGQVLHFVKDIVVTWDRSYGFGYDHCYCLVFRNDSESNAITRSP